MKAQRSAPRVSRSSTHQAPLFDPRTIPQTDAILHFDPRAAQCQELARRIPNYRSFVTCIPGNPKTKNTQPFPQIREAYTSHVTKQTIYVTHTGLRRCLKWFKLTHTAPSSSAPAASAAPAAPAAPAAHAAPAAPAASATSTPLPMPPPPPSQKMGQLTPGAEKRRRARQPSNSDDNAQNWGGGGAWASDLQAPRTEDGNGNDDDDSVAVRDANGNVIGMKSKRPSPPRQPMTMEQMKAQIAEMNAEDAAAENNRL